MFDWNTIGLPAFILYVTQKIFKNPENVHGAPSSRHTMNTIWWGTMDMSTEHVEGIPVPIITLLIVP